MLFPAIDILRAYAALSVLVYHVAELFEWKTFPQSGPLSWFNVGGIGVDLFFVISGFVITLSAFSKIEKNPHGFKTEFSVHRFARIAPLHYLTCGVFIIFIYPHYLFDGTLALDSFLHIFFVHNLSERYHGAINGVNWSIGLEMQFYLFILLCAPILRTARPWRMALAFIATAWVWRYQVMLHTDVNGPAGGFPRFWAITQLPGVIDEFAAGILLARFVSSDAGRRAIAYCENRPRALAIVVIALSWPAMLFLRHFLSAGWVSTGMCVFGRTGMAVIWAGLVFVACCVRSPVALRLTAPVRYLGTISYGIYLWHLPVIMTLHLRLTWLNGQRALPYVIIVTCCLAAASWHFFELPLMEKAKAWLNARKAATRRPILAAAPLPLPYAPPSQAAATAEKTRAPIPQYEEA